MNRLKPLYTVVSIIVLSGILSGCVGNHHVTISANEISKIWMETYPASSDSPKYTDDEEIINKVSSYINGLTLRPRTSSDEDVYGMTVRIDVLMLDGTWRTYFDSRRYFTDADMKQYVLNYEQSIELDSIYKKLESVPLIIGTVTEVRGIDINYTCLLIAVDSAFQHILGDTSYVTVENQRLYKSGYPNADIGIGDKVKFTINGGIDTSYPTQCGAAMLTITEPASGLFFQHLPSVSEDGNPYFVLFTELFSVDPGLNSDIQYISFDLSKVKSSNTSDFTELMMAWCERNGFIFMEQTYEQLMEGGWIRDSYFEDGILISFEDISITDTKLVTNAKKWRSGLGAIGAKYTLENDNGIWNITNTTQQWIS